MAVHFTLLLLPYILQQNPKKINVHNAFYIKILVFTGASPMAHHIKNLPEIQETQETQV